MKKKGMKKISFISLLIMGLLISNTYADQSCSYVTDSEGNVVWRCKNTDESGNISSWSDTGDDVYRSYDADMNITDYGVFTKKLNEYGDKTEWIQTYYRGNPNDDIEDELISKKERFYTYTNNSRNDNTWLDINYQTYKKITYGVGGLPQSEWHVVYSNDGLMMDIKEVYYTDGILTEEKGGTYKSTCPYDQLDVESSLCPDQ